MSKRMAWVPVLEQAIEAELALDAMMDLVHASGSHDSTRPAAMSRCHHASSR